MKSFKQFIVEEELVTEKRTPLFTSLPYKGSKQKGSVTGLENPSPMELLGFLKRTTRNMVRYIVNGKGKLLVWDAEDAIHQEVITGESWDKNDVGLGVIYRNVHLEGEKRNTLTVEIYRKIRNASKSKTLKTLKDREGTMWEPNSYAV